MRSGSTHVTSYVCLLYGDHRDLHVLTHAFPTRRSSDLEEIWALLQHRPLNSLIAASQHLTLSAHGRLVTYSRKVFIPLTKLCRDVCHYCTFATTPSDVGKAYLSREEVLEIARAGERAGCREALFTLGDRPEARYAAARDALTQSGHDSTLSYLGDMARAVLEETGLLPHLNPGLMEIGRASCRESVCQTVEI